MDEYTAPAETAAKDALAAVIGDSPQDARRIIASLPFRGRAMLAAWAEELDRLVRDEQSRYTARERDAWRAVVRRMDNA